MSIELLAMTSVIAIVSLLFSVAHHLCRHSSRLFVSCSVFENECYLRYHSFSCLLSLSLYVHDDDDVFSSASSCSFLSWEIVPFSLLDYIRLSGVSLSLSRQGFNHYQRDPHRIRHHVFDLGRYDCGVATTGDEE